MNKIKNPKSLLIKMIMFLVLLLVLPLSFAGIYLYNEVNRDLTQMEKESVLTSNQAAQKLLEKVGENLLGVLKTNALWEENRIAVKNKDVNWINQNINVSTNSISNISFIATTDLNGSVISQVGDIQEFQGTLANKDILTKLESKSQITGLIETSKGLAVIAASKITNDDETAEPTGVLIFGRLLDNKTLGEIKDTLQNDAALLTNDGTMLTTSENITKGKLSQNLAKINKNPNAKLFETSQDNSVENAQMSTALKDFSGKPIGVLSLNQKQVTSTSVKSKLLNVNIIIGAILLFMLVLLSFMIHRLMIKPIQHLVAISHEVSDGILTSEVKDSVTNRRDELGKLGNSLNIMIDNFRNLIIEVTQTIDQVAASAEQLSASSEETTQATHQISTAIQQVASGSDAQLQGTIDSSNAVKEMVQGINNVAETVSFISVHSTKTEEEVEQGNQSILKAAQQMENINVSFKESAVIVNKLAESSNEIAKIASSISDIANQTNLLSLNAAIEAARAGEQGRGFAVVADEVRKLAVQTSTSAEQVSKLIGVIKQESVSTVESMDKVNHEVSEGLKQIDNVEHVFEHILSATQEVAGQTQELSAVTTQMSEITSKVLSSVDEVAAIARNSADSSKNVAYSSKEQLVAMQEITSASGYLTKMSQELKILIHKFKI